MICLPVCTLCGRSYPETGAPFLCECGGVFDYQQFPEYRAETINPKMSGLWKYQSMLGLPDSALPITLGEGNTPLVETDFSRHPVWLKLEYQNPTGSYKDRGSAVLASFLLSRGVKSAVEDSSGNAGASFAAYAARAGLQTQIFVPESASGPKRKQIEMYGAELVLVPGARSEAARAVRQAADQNIAYASHAYMPFGLTGIATIAYEIAASLGGNAPGTLVAPVGHGGLLYGAIRGFKALKKAAVVDNEPYYVGVQTSGCAPVFTAFQNHEFSLREALESDTIAEGVRVKNPVRGAAILKALSDGRGEILKVEEADLLNANQEIAHRGFFVEPTSALVWAVLGKMIGNVPEPVVLILTGSGYKTQY